MHCSSPDEATHSFPANYGPSLPSLAELRDSIRILNPKAQKHEAQRIESLCHPKSSAGGFNRLKVYGLGFRWHLVVLCMCLAQV